MTEVLRELDAEADAEYELESEEGSLFTGSVMLIGGITMAWAAVAFSYFYLREVDNQTALFRPHGVRPPFLLGNLIGISVLAGAILYSWAINRVRNGMAFEFELASWLACGCACVATALQAWQLTRLGFSPGMSGYTSVFVGFAILNIGFLFYGALWSEMVAARALRLRGMYPPETYIGVSVRPQVRVWRASTRGCLLFWWFMVLAETFFWVLFYVL